MSSNGRVQIGDFSDREILAMLLDLGGEVASVDLAARIYGWSRIEEADKDKLAHGKRCVSSRLSWMRRFGLVVRDEEGDWAISEIGRAFAVARTNTSVASVIAHSREDHGLLLANLVGERMVGAGETEATAMRREFQFQINRRKRR